MQHIVQPHTPLIHDAAESMRLDVVDEIALNEVDEFKALNIGLSHWVGASQESFAKFFTRLETSRNYQAYVANHVARGLQLAEGILNEGQTALQNLVDKIDAALDEQIQARAASHQPQSTGEAVTEIVGLALIGMSLFTAI
jgi:hypothetical protein